VRANGEDYDIYCGDEKAGTLKHGVKGDKGDDAPGAVENNCVLGSKNGNSWDIQCGSTTVQAGGSGGVELPGDLCYLGPESPPGSNNYTIVCKGISIGEEGGIQGNLDACTVDKTGTKGFQLILVCPGVELYFCSGALFDPETEYCATGYTLYGSASTTGLATDDGTIAVVASDGTSATARAYGYVKPALCNTDSYDSRYQFCDESGTPTIRPLCGGKFGAPYRQGAGALLWNEKCDDGKVARDCGSKRYVLATQFCEDRENGIVKDRCGVASSKGIYNDGKSEITNIDRTYENSSSKTDGSLIMGEYSTADGELCVDKKVVKLCGTETYSQKTHFCAVGDVVAPHCTDRRIYDPRTQYCSFMGNSYFTTAPTATSYGTAKPGALTGSTNASLQSSFPRNIQEIAGNGFFNYLDPDIDPDETCPSSTGTGKDPSSTKCLKYASTAIEYCGYTPGVSVGEPTAANKPNEGAWRWEYCRDMDATASGTHSANKNGAIIRCAELQIPPTSRPGATASNTCLCIDNAVPISATANGCKCAEGWSYKFIGNTATGRYNNNGKEFGASAGAQMEYDGGECEAKYASGVDGGACGTGVKMLVRSGNDAGKYDCLATSSCAATTNTLVAIAGTGSSGGFAAQSYYKCAVGTLTATGPTQTEINTICGTTGTNTRLLLVSDGPTTTANTQSTLAGAISIIGTKGVRCVDVNSINDDAFYAQVGSSLIYECLAATSDNGTNNKRYNHLKGTCETPSP